MITNNLNYQVQNLSALTASIYNLQCSFQVFTFLLKSSADVNLKNQFGETAVTYLYNTKRYAEIKFILASGLKIDKLKAKERAIV